MYEKQNSAWQRLSRNRVAHGIAMLGLAAALTSGYETNQHNQLQNVLPAEHQESNPTVTAELFASPVIGSESLQLQHEHAILAQRAIAAKAASRSQDRQTPNIVAPGCANGIEYAMQQKVPAQNLDNVSLACELAKDQPWAKENFSAQLHALVSLWRHESGWNETARNSSTGAAGIPQALPGSKMGPGWQNDPRQQIAWGLDYITSRYGSPLGAWSFFQQHNWY